ncbi:MAG TPA: HlyD family secretion protein [Geobacteraceae bacterium]|nr:HlyD family secretion protein [Geobacteraceae bacterium]
MEKENPQNDSSVAVKKDSPPPPQRLGNGRRRAGFILLVLLVAGVIITCWLWCRSKTHVTTDNAFVESHVYSISARVPGNVARVMVNDNQSVKGGDLLVELDPADYRVRLADAKANFAIAVNETTSNYAQVEAARAALNSDKAKLSQADIDLERGRALFRKDVIPKEQLDRLETARKVADARLTETEGSVKRALAILGLTGKGGKDALIARRKAEMEESILNLSYTRIYAPADGYITRKSVEPGNNIQAGQPLLALVALNEVWVTANYKESQLTHVHPGQKVEFKVDTYPGRRFAGVVDSIMAGTGAAFSLLPPENATGNYVKVVQRIPVKIVIDRESDPQHLLRVGMSVEPTILTGRKIGDILKELNPF